MDPVRDLGRIEPWQESLERSRARRDASTRRSVTDRNWRCRPASRRSPMLAIGAGGAAAVAFLLVVLWGGLTNRSGRALVTAANTRAASASGRGNWDGAGPISRGVVSRPVKVGQLPTCQPVSGPHDYVNPLADAHVRPERI